jgi:uncharacterized phage protein (TIGR01671 family)
MKERRLKFRAWDKEKKEMIHWYPDADIIKDAIPNDCGDEWTEQCEVMQYTGINDKNGKEIYEGDLIKYDKDEYDKIGPGIVEFFAGMFVCSWNDQTDSELGYMIINNMEVIGNVFGNPELLEYKK